MDSVINSEVFWTALAVVFGVSTSGAALAFAAKYAAGWSREAWDRARGQVPAAIEAVNDPRDPMIVWLDRYVPGHADQVMAAALPVFLRTVADQLDHALRDKEAVR
jgi:hypothetical protein